MQTGGKRFRRVAALTAGVAALWLPATAAAGRAAVIEPSASGSYAQVVAQGLVTFDDGPQHWSVASVAVGATPVATAADAPTFLLSGGAVPLLVTNEDDTGWRLAGGEAVYTTAGSSGTVAAVGAGTASLTTIGIEPGPGLGEFTPGAGVRDVDLVRGDVLPGGSLVVHADASALVLVSSGTVELADGTTVAAGSTATAPGDVTLTNSATDVAATVVVAAVGAAADSAGTVAPTTVEASPAPPPAPAPTTPPTPPPTNPTTTVDPATLDVDDDGLTGADEALRGTDPNTKDSDGDDLDDGFEVFESGTNPTDADSDADGVNDGAEVKLFGTNPSSADTDGDGTDDRTEIDGGTDPLDAASF